MNAQTYLQSHAKTRAQIDAFLKLDYQDAYLAKGLGWTYDTELGWTLVNSIRHDGIEGSKTYYHYEPTDARQRRRGGSGRCARSCRCVRSCRCAPGQ